MRDSIMEDHGSGIKDQGSGISHTGSANRIYEQDLRTGSVTPARASGAGRAGSRAAAAAAAVAAARRASLRERAPPAERLHGVESIEYRV